jgi:hypothetical protein
MGAILNADPERDLTAFLAAVPDQLVSRDSGVVTSRCCRRDAGTPGTGRCRGPAGSRRCCFTDWGEVSQLFDADIAAPSALGSHPRCASRAARWRETVGERLR